MCHIVMVTITALLLVFLNRQGAAGISIITILVLRLILKTFPSTFLVCQLCVLGRFLYIKREREKKTEENADKQSGSPYCTKKFQAQHKLPIRQVFVFADDMILGGRYMSYTPFLPNVLCR